MKLLVLTVGKPREKKLAELACDYLARIRPSGLVGVERVPDVNARSPEEAMEREGQELLRRIQPRDRVILLREDGKEHTSPSFAEILSYEMEQAAGRVVLVIGGPWGTSASVKKRANTGLALSRMTFTHEMCFLFLAEQLYRAFSILQGTGYHH
ncbi:MAG: 23S rRNA (pseudouridine(1915)-N(3))-methyltransferase RlmH [Fretibacterium sp.]|nr:23S rRNA (pseudouridine(1915)-N(3))-methyltransferase RlmH [Fretibacterium sp.]